MTSTFHFRVSGLKNTFSLPLLLIALLFLSALFSCDTDGKVLKVTPGQVIPNVRASESFPYYFQSLSDAVRAAEAGDSILVEPGRYGETTEQFPIAVDKPIGIRSTKGPEQTIFTGPRGKQLFVISAPGVEIQGITIEHGGTGILVLANNVSIIGNVIKLSSSSPPVFTCGIWLAGVRYAYIARNTFIDCGLALAGPPVTAANVDLPSLTGIFTVGHDPQWFTTHTIVDNKVNGKPLAYLVGVTNRFVSEETGQVILAGCSNITVSGLDIARASVGVQIVHCERIFIDDCRFEQNSLFGVYIAYSKDCKITGAQAIRNNHGIDVRASISTVLSRNTAAGNEQGFFLAFTKHSLVFECTAVDNGNGIFLDNCMYDMVYCNSAIGNRYGIFAQKTSDLQITHNHLAENTLCGLRLSPGCHKITIVGNRFEKNSTSALLANTSDVSLFNNLFVNASSADVYLWDSTGVNIICNAFYGNAVALEVAGTTCDAIIRLNSFYGERVLIRNETPLELDAKMNWWSTGIVERLTEHIEGRVALSSLLHEDNLCVNSREPCQ